MTSTQKEKTRVARRKQQKVVEAFKKRLREEVKPHLRSRKRKQRLEVSEKQKQVTEKAGAQIKEARDRLRQNVGEFTAKVGEAKEKIRAQQRKQGQAARAQEEKIERTVKPLIERNQDKLEKQRIERRMRQKSHGKMLYSFRTMPSKKFMGIASRSRKHSTRPDPEFRDHMNYSPKKSTIPEPEFAETIKRPLTHKTVPTPEFAEALSISLKNTTVPNPLFNEKLARPLTYSPMKLEKEMEARARRMEEESRR